MNEKGHAQRGCAMLSQRRHAGWIRLAPGLRTEAKALRHRAMFLVLSRKPVLLLSLTALAALALWHGAPSTAVPDAGGAAAAPRPVVPAPVAPGAALLVSAAPRAVLRSRVDFEQVDDLYRYAHDLAAADRDGDADAGWMLSRVRDYCAGFALDPAGYAGDTRAIGEMHLAVSPALVAARERIGRRCAGFAPVDALAREAVLAHRRATAQAGSLAAEASLLALGQPLAQDAAYRRGLVERVRASRDPEAFVALAPAMGIAASGEDTYEGMVAGTRYTELAWQMAACRLGLDCSASGALMTSYCANAGICSRDGRQDFVSFVLDAAVPRQGEEVVRGMVETLLNGTGTSK